MPDTQPIAVLLERWFEDGNELAHRQAYNQLRDRLVPTPEAVRVPEKVFAPLKVCVPARMASSLEVFGKL